MCLGKKGGNFTLNYYAHRGIQQTREMHCCYLYQIINVFNENFNQILIQYD